LIGIYENLPAIFGVLRLSWGVGMIPATKPGTSTAPREEGTPETQIGAVVNKLP
jgi:hypothetical protein